MPINADDVKWGPAAFPSTFVLNIVDSRGGIAGVYQRREAKRFMRHD
jgi:hypothetical protein